MVYVTAGSVGDFLPDKEAIVAVWCRILSKLKREVAEEVLEVAPVAVRCIYRGLYPRNKTKAAKQPIGHHRGPRKPNERKRMRKHPDRGLRKPTKEVTCP
jgi:hypothetical protein